MFKSLLVCLAFIACPILWGNVAKAVQSDIADVSQGNILPTDIQSESKKLALEAAQSDEATSTELRAFEELALTDPIRALELSMYYQGWGKGECFYVFDDKDSDSPITRTYVKDSELTRQITMRDFDKALMFAEIAFNNIPVTEEYKTIPVDEKFKFIKSEVDLNLMKLYILRGEDFAKETFTFFVEKVASHNFEKEGKLYCDKLYRKFDGPPSWAFKYKELHVYFYFKGFGVEQDLAFAKDLLHEVYRNRTWRDFFMPKYHVKDLEFVKFLIEECEGAIQGNYFLYLIYSGRFNAKEKDEALARQYFDTYENRRNKYIKNNTEDQFNIINEYINHPKYSLTSYSASKMRFHLQKYFFFGFLYDEILLIPNPYYNIELAKKYMKNIEPYLAWRVMFASLKNGYAIKEYKKQLFEMEKSEDLTQEQKDKFKNTFIGVYNSIKGDICNDLYNDIVKIDIDNF